MTLKSRCGSISGDSEVAAPPSNAAPRLSNAFAFLSTRSKTKNFWRLRRRTTHRQTEYQRSIIQSKETERKLEYYPSTKPGQVQPPQDTGGNGCPYRCISPLLSHNSELWCLVSLRMRCVCKVPEKSHAFPPLEVSVYQFNFHDSVVHVEGM